MKKTRPDVLPGETRKVKTGCGNTYVTITEDSMPGGAPAPFEVFITMGKSGGCQSVMQEAVGRLLSLLLRSGGDLGEAAEQLVGLSCHMPYADINKSCVDALAQALEAYLKERRKRMVEFELFRICENCGWEVKLGELIRDPKDNQPGGQCPQCGYFLYDEPSEAEFTTDRPVGGRCR
jgi:ribonucleoside-diphosphate reductase alpha chain